MIIKYKGNNVLRKAIIILERSRKHQIKFRTQSSRSVILHAGRSQDAKMFFFIEELMSGSCALRTMVVSCLKFVTNFGLCAHWGTQPTSHTDVVTKRHSHSHTDTQTRRPMYRDRDMWCSLLIGVFRVGVDIRSASWSHHGNYNCMMTRAWPSPLVTRGHNELGVITFLYYRGLRRD